MAAGHGGARAGAGRKPKGDAPAPPRQFDDALAYLVAVATGHAPGDGLRVAAAKAVLPYTRPKSRAPVESPSPRELARSAELAGNADEREAWNRKAAEIRAKLRK